MKRSGFTLVEMIMVMAIIAILLGLITLAARSAIQTARGHRNDSMRQMLQGAVNAYYAQKGRWPEPLESYVQNANFADSDGDDSWFSMATNDVDSVFHEILVVSTGGGSPLLDVSGLFVARQGAVDGKAYGMDFTEAAKGTKTRAGIPIQSMVIGYPDRKTGRFRRYGMRYSVQGDFVKVD